MPSKWKWWSPRMAHVVSTLVLLSLCILYYLPDWLSKGSGLRFDNPWFLLALGLIPVLIWVGMFEYRTAGRVRFPMMRAFAGTSPGWKTHLLPVSTGMRAAGMALLIVALARPQDSNRPEETQLEGVDLVLTLDVSLSMKAADLEPTRLEAAKAVVLDFVKRRKNDRIGAVIFAENAFTLCPLTLDYSILSNMIKDVELGIVDGNATAIGNALGVSINRLRKSDAKSKAIILLTDGSSNAGNISPEQATLFAKTMGIRIYTVLMGSQNEAPVSKGLDFFRQQIFGNQAVPINRELMVEMSEKTGGAFFEATDRKGLVSSFHAILDALERSRISDQGVVYSEKFATYLWPGLILILLESLIGIFILRRMP